MSYTREQAEVDKARLLEMATKAETDGNVALASIWRVEAENCLDRVGFKKPHRNNLGPYTKDNHCHCEHCGKPYEQWTSANEECIPIPGLMRKIDE